MCGIAGIIHFDEKPVEKNLLDKMREFLVTRGPDANGDWIEKNIGLTHTRLSIVDLSENANQPMMDGSGRTVITYNGEIYNYKELAKELRSLGCSFKTQSDTEVLLHGYLQWGIEKLLQKADGMFAFVLYDKKNHLAFACRDRFGKKPLYYFLNSEKIIFSSDIRAIWKIEKTLTLDFESLDYYLTELSVPQPKTIWNEIKQVNPSSYIEINIEKKQATESLYWQIDFTKKIQDPVEEEIEIQLETMLTAAIIKRTIGDVPIGCFLSAGADSGLTTAILASNSSTQVNTFTVGVSETEMNELPFAKMLSQRYNTNHTEIIVNPDVIHIIPELVEHFGEPFADSSSIPSFYISKAIRKNVKVALGGDGGDEIFGGYHEYGSVFLTEEYLKKYPGKNNRNITRRVNQVAYKLGLTKNNLGHLNDYLKIPGGMKLHREMGFHPKEMNKLYHPYLIQRKDFSRSHLETVWSRSQNNSLTDTLLKASLSTRLLNDYLVKVDRMSMMNSLEVRSPYLDYKLAEFAASVPNSIKLKNGTQKYLLKKLALKYIDKDFFTRKKKGFGIPLHNWLRNELKDYTREIIFGGSLANRQFFNMKYVHKIFDEHQSGKHDHTHRIWALVCLELWFKKFYQA